MVWTAGSVSCSKNWKWMSLGPYAISWALILTDTVIDKIIQSWTGDY
jgi:hypothetical protein